MCGIFGYIGPRNPANICLTGLKHLEYRGYDSAGLAGILEGQLFSCKEVGKIHALENALLQQPVRLDLAIAHTRWATHGIPSKENAHPHIDEQQTVAVVHNGIIENHFALREMLQAKGKTFYSDTDTEVIAQLVAYYYEGEILPAVQKALSQLRGFWGIAVIHKNHPNQIVAAARENPIAIGINSTRSEAFVSSDANAFGEANLDVMFLRNDEVALISPDKVEVFDQTFNPVQKNTERLDNDSVTISKNGYAHFMLKEIFEQPQTIQQAFHNRMIPDFGTAEFDNLTFSPSDLLGCPPDRNPRLRDLLACRTDRRLPTRRQSAHSYPSRDRL